VIAYNFANFDNISTFSTISGIALYALYKSTTYLLTINEKESKGHVMRGRGPALNIVTSCFCWLRRTGLNHFLGR